MSELKLTKKGKPDRRSETSKANISKAQKTVKAVLEKAKKIESEDELEFSDSSSSEEIEPEVEKKPRIKTKDLIKGLMEKIDKLNTHEPVEKNPVPIQYEEPKVITPKQIEKIKRSGMNCFIKF